MKLNWSKNEQEDRDALWQMMMGSIDSEYCVLISIVLRIEFKFMANPSEILNPYLFPLSDYITIHLGVQKSKDIAQIIIWQRIF
jgi:hypothetical protein